MSRIEELLKENQTLTNKVNKLQEQINLLKSENLKLQKEVFEYKKMEELYLKKISSEVGTVVRTIIARTYKDYSVTALAKVGVAVRDAKGEFRELSDIMADLDKAWRNLTNTHK